MTCYGIFYNPNAGNGESEKTAIEVKEALKKEKKDVLFLTGNDELQAIEAIISAMDQIDIMIAIGGDGSLNIVGTAFIRANKTVPLGIIPEGTINNFAKRWQIPTNKEQAIETILNNQTRKVSIGKCGNQAIISSFTFGRLADISNDVRQNEKQKYGLIVYPLKALKHIGRKTSYSVKFKTEAIEKTLKTWVTLATTTSYVGGIHYTIHDANAFHLSILNDMSVLKSWAFLNYAFTGQLKGKRAITYIEAERIELFNTNPADVIQSRIDGDPGPNLPLVLEWQKDFLDLIVPDNKKT